MKNRLRLAKLLADGKLHGKELRDAEANPIVSAEATRIKRSRAGRKRKTTSKRKGGNN